MIGQKIRENISPGFTGGQTPIFLTAPKHGMARQYESALSSPHLCREPIIRYEPLNLWKLQEFVQAGRIDGSKLIDLKAIFDSRIVGKIQQGVKLLAGVGCSWRFSSA
jgi:large subunit ribosomal protein L15